jgi:predicted P-loop ATPase
MNKLTTKEILALTPEEKTAYWTGIARPNNQASDLLNANKKAQAKKASRKVAKAIEFSVEVASESSAANDKKIQATRPNLAEALASYKPRYDAFLNRFEITLDEQLETLNDKTSREIAQRLEENGFSKVRRSESDEVIETMAYRNQIDRANEWCNSLQWDGVPRVLNLFTDYFGCDDTVYANAVSLYFMTALAGRAVSVNPEGIQADSIPVLVGDQGLRKSTGVQALAPIPNSFVEVSFALNDADLARTTQGKLVAEIAELNGLKSKDSEWLKAWVSRRVDEWIPKYSNRTTSAPRRFMCIGTTNEAEFLADVTGNRRWYPLDVVRMVDVGAIVRDREQLWAEAVHLFHTKGVLWEGAKREAEKLNIQDRYMVSSEWTAEIEAWLDKVYREGKTPREIGFFTTAEILTDCFGIPKADTDIDRHKKAVARALKPLGYINKGRRRNGKLGKGWVEKLPVTPNVTPNTS